MSGSHFLYCHLKKKKKERKRPKQRENPVVTVTAAVVVVELVGVRLAERLHGGEAQKHTQSPFKSSYLFRLSDICRAVCFPFPPAAADSASGSLYYSPQTGNVNTENPVTPGTHQCFCCLFPHVKKKRKKETRTQDGQLLQSLDTEKPFKQLYSALTENDKRMQV